MVAGRAATSILAAFAGYLVVVLVLATTIAVRDALGGDRPAIAAFMVVMSGIVLVGAAITAWLARRDQRSWWRTVRRASVVVVVGAYVVAILYDVLTAPF